MASLIHAPQREWLSSDQLRAAVLFSLQRRLSCALCILVHLAAH